jgi:5-methylcytosine-specific restriction endonuclease McrA
VETSINPKSGRLAKKYRCASCKELFTSINIDVDHIKPIVGPEGFTTWDKFIENLFCPVENLQTLCKACHKAKTLSERKK